MIKLLMGICGLVLAGLMGFSAFRGETWEITPTGLAYIAGLIVITASLQTANGALILYGRRLQKKIGREKARGVSL